MRRSQRPGLARAYLTAVTLLYGLVAFGQIQLRKIDGHRHLSELLAPVAEAAA